MMKFRCRTYLSPLLVCLAACAAVLAVPAAAPEGSPAGPDAQAAAVSGQVLEAVGGRAALAGTNYVRFTLVVEKEGAVRLSRTHYWDLRKQLHRLETTEKDGSSVVCLTHLPSREGVCTVGEKVLMDEEAKPRIVRTLAAWTHDLHWLMMPYLIKDPDVSLKYGGEVKEGAAVFDKLLVDLENAGLTPRDKSWIYVDRKTHRIDRWACVLRDESGPPMPAEPGVWAWKGWTRFGKLMLSTERIAADGKAKVLFKNVAVFDELPGEVFSKTSKVEIPSPKP